MIYVTDGIELSPSEFMSICNQSVIVNRTPKLGDPRRVEPDFITVKDRETYDVVGRMWFNSVARRWFWFHPDDVDDELFE